MDKWMDGRMTTWPLRNTTAAAGSSGLGAPGPGPFLFPREKPSVLIFKIPCFNMFFSNDLGVKGMEQHFFVLYYSSVNLQILLLFEHEAKWFLLYIYIYKINIFINIFY